MVLFNNPKAASSSLFSLNPGRNALPSVLRSALLFPAVTNVHSCKLPSKATEGDYGREQDTELGSAAVVPFYIKRPTTLTALSTLVSPASECAK